MTKPKAISKEQAKKIARDKYEKDGRGTVVMRVQLSKKDDAAEWEVIKNDLVKKYGNAKKGIYELYQNAKSVGTL